MRRQIIFSNYDDPRNPFYGGGGARAIHEVARRLADRHAVQVITGKYPGCRDEVLDGVRYTRIGSERAGPRTGQLLFQFLLPRQVRRAEFDLWVESLTPPFSTACLQLWTHKPVIALTQVLAGRAMTRKYRLPFALVEHWGLKTYHHAIALSQYLRTELARVNPRMQVAVIPNGVTRELIELRVNREEAHVLFLGRIDVEQKGLDLLLNAFQGVAHELALPLVIAGSGAPREEAFVRDRIKALCLEARVRTVGHVTGAEKHELLRRAAWLVMPSRFEASPLVLAEAFCYELPVVMFAIPELAELPDTCCLKVPPFDEAAFGQAMVDLWRRPKRRLELGQAAKQFARGLDWDELAKKYEDFFESVLRNR